MKTYLDCFPCFLQQTLRTGRVATTDEKLIKNLIDEVGMMIKDIPMENTPPETGGIIYHKISQVTQNFDPYYNIKQKNIAHAMQLYPALKEKVAQSDDRLLTAIRLAIAGNVIDLGVEREFDLEKDIEEVLEQDFAIFDYEEFRQKIAEAKTILYIGDNAGEAVFDRIFMEELQSNVIFAVREIPVLNDVTSVEAEQIGIDKIALIISSGATAPGTILKYCNTNFQKIFQTADLIISKGQGNYEGLSQEKAPIFFLLKVKCNVIAQDLGAASNDIILKGQNIC